MFLQSYPDEKFDNIPEISGIKQLITSSTKTNESQTSNNNILII